MALVRWEPVRELTSLQNEMNRLFTTFFDTPTGGNGERRAPLDPGDGPRRDRGPLRPQAPTFPASARATSSLEVEDNVLTVSGERKAEHEDKREGYVRVERSYGAFRRSLTLPEGIDPEGVTASFDKGVLEVRIPKPEERKPRRVAIQVGDARRDRGQRAA